MNNKVETILNMPIRRITVIVIDLVLIVISLLIIYNIIGAPAFTTVSALRREETRHLIGPGEIIGEIDIDGSSSAYVVDEGGGMAVFYSGNLYHVEYPYDMAFIRHSYSLIFAFDNIPEAEYAELELLVEYTTTGRHEKYSFDYISHAQREYDGIFAFYFQYPSTDSLSPMERYIFSEFTLGRLEPQATARFYDSSGELIAELNVAIS